MARPPKPIDSKQVMELAKISCTMNEMAAVLGCSVDTLERRFADIIKEGREHGRMSLKRKQYEVAMGGNVTMLIWLGKQLLDQSEKVVQRTELSGQVKVERDQKAIEEFRELLSNKFNERKPLKESDAVIHVTGQS